VEVGAGVIELLAVPALVLAIGIAAGVVLGARMERWKR
jgi:hypothetical protein